jgi:hypothetical protein
MKLLSLKVDGDYVDDDVDDLISVVSWRTSGNMVEYKGEWKASLCVCVFLRGRVRWDVWKWMNEVKVSLGVFDDSKTLAQGGLHVPLARDLPTSYTNVIKTAKTLNFVFSVTYAVWVWMSIRRMVHLYAVCQWAGIRRIYWETWMRKIFSPKRRVGKLGFRAECYIKCI